MIINIFVYPTAGQDAKSERRILHTRQDVGTQNEEASEQRIASAAFCIGGI